MNQEQIVGAYNSSTACELTIALPGGQRPKLAQTCFASEKQVATAFHENVTLGEGERQTIPFSSALRPDRRQAPELLHVLSGYTRQPVGAKKVAAQAMPAAILQQG